MKNNKRFLYLILMLIMYLLLDYFNVLTRIGINIKNVNLELFNIFVVIILYISTFYFIDKKQIEKENNKVEVSKLILKSVYEMCLENIELYDDKVINKNIVPKCDFDKTIFEDEFMSKLLNQPFQSENILLELLKDGSVPKDIYEEYLTCKESYISYLSKRIMLFDRPELSMNAKDSTISILKKSLASLNRLEL